MTREELLKDQESYREAYKKTIADANAIKGCLQYIDLKLAELSEEKRIVVPGPGDRIPTDAEMGKR